MDGIFLHTLQPDRADAAEDLAALARTLYVRAHWLRMPPLLLTICSSKHSGASK